ncbi:MAG TPA: acetyl-CoA C-acyltransferase [Polyangiales bacterium]|nr:acetyl-CoA C-acyltransferase [Polyangiales bacterium]
MTLPAVFLVSAARTPLGAFLGAFAELPAPQLAAAAIRGALGRAGLAPEQVSLTVLGNVLSAGLGQAPARQAAIRAGIPHSVPALGVSKVCGSGLEAAITGARAIALGDADVVVAGGMESMSQAPYLLPKARSGQRLGHGALLDSMLLDGLWDPYGDFHMGEAAERCATQLGIGRSAQDEYARSSYQRAREAQASFAAEIEPVSVPGKRGETVVREDEEPTRADLSKLETLKPAFRAGGTITAGNASKLNDGAAALVLASEDAVKRHGLSPMARIVTWAHHAQEPERFPTAPAYAIDKALTRAGLAPADVDLYEINEAFAVVAIGCMQLARLDRDRVNVRGGAVALGHPIGCSGARILTTLAYAMRDRQAKRGLATLCIGGGEANAVIVERV